MFAGVTLDTHASSHWWVAGTLLLGGLGLFEWQRKRFKLVWDQVQSELAGSGGTT